MGVGYPNLSTALGSASELTHTQTPPVSFWGRQACVSLASGVTVLPGTPYLTDSHRVVSMAQWWNLAGCPNLQMQEETRPLPPAQIRFMKLLSFLQASLKSRTRKKEVMTLGSTREIGGHGHAGVVIVMTSDSTVTGSNLTLDQGSESGSGLGLARLASPSPSLTCVTALCHPSDCADRPCRPPAGADLLQPLLPLLLRQGPHRP